ncbi:MAG: DUF438 domain-containing protein [Bacteroidales bacterium]|nr:DUF438 domain-containing protein [Bacteroidales bacterium]
MKQPETEKIRQLLILAEAVVRGENGKPYYDRFFEAVHLVTPEEVVFIVDELYRKQYPIDQLKTGINKFLNFFFRTLDSYPLIKPAPGTFLHLMMLDNQRMEAILDALRPYIKQLNNKPAAEKPAHSRAIELLEQLRSFNNHYLIKENILFPALEQAWPDYRCVQVMWSFHDDIRQNLKTVLELLKTDQFDTEILNPLFGKVFFDMLAIKFREDRILFPVIHKTFSLQQLQEMLEESIDIKFPFIKQQEMSELINNSKNRKSQLKTLLLKIHEGVDPEQVKAELIDVLQEVSYGEVVEVEQELIEEGMPAEEIQKFCDIHSLVLEGSIDLSGVKIVPPGHPVDTFRRENAMLKETTGRARNLLNQLAEPGEKEQELILHLLAEFNSLMDVDKHYQRKEYLLFPFLEKKGITGPPKVMWGKHDEIRERIKDAIEILRTPGLSAAELLGKRPLLFDPALNSIDDMVIKEEEILFPMSLDNLSETEWFDIYKQTLSIGFCLYDPVDEWKPTGIEISEQKNSTLNDSSIQLPSGSFSTEEIMAILNTLPVDMTFVDQNDKVKYFSRGSHRIFTRSRSIINRDVRLCHPPGSVHIVEKILEDFKTGKADRAPFWIQMNNRFIYIEYYALRNEAGEYLGTLEVSQDLTEQRKLEGEQRILSYE